MKYDFGEQAGFVALNGSGISTLYKHDKIYSEKNEGYLDSILYSGFNTIKTKLNIHAFNILRYKQLKRMLNLSNASMFKVQHSSKWFNPLY